MTINQAADLEADRNARTRLLDLGISVKGSAKKGFRPSRMYEVARIAINRETIQRFDGKIRQKSAERRND